jgi:hypothetical protein
MFGCVAMSERLSLSMEPQRAVKPVVSRSVRLPTPDFRESNLLVGEVRDAGGRVWKKNSMHLQHGGICHLLRSVTALISAGKCISVTNATKSPSRPFALLTSHHSLEGLSVHSSSELEVDSSSDLPASGAFGSSASHKDYKRLSPTAHALLSCLCLESRS